MCYFVTIGLAAKRASRLEQVVPRSLATAPVTNASVLRRLPAGYRTYLLTSGMCSCDLFIPATPPPDRNERQAAKLRRLRAKYVQRGWSAAKIERALAQATARPPEEPPFIGLRPNLCKLLADVAEEVGELSIVVHWYNGDVESETVNLEQGPRVTASAMRAGTISIPEDQVVSVYTSPYVV